jgi:hypothetical protein
MNFLFFSSHTIIHYFVNILLDLFLLRLIACLSMIFFPQKPGSNQSISISHSPKHTLRNYRECRLPPVIPNKIFLPTK